MTNHPKIHPLIVSITPLDPTTGLDGMPVQHYHIRDRMRVSPLTLAFTYHATTRLNRPNELKLEAFQFPRIRLFNTTRFLAEGVGRALASRYALRRCAC